VKDSKGHLVQGRTRWRRFAAVCLPAAVLGATLMAGVANGAVPVVVTVNAAGGTFKVSADSLDGGPFSQYSGLITTKEPMDFPPFPQGTRGVVATAIDDATLKNLCQSVKVEPLPGIVPPVSLLIRAGQGANEVRAHDLFIGLDALSGNAEFTNLDIGVDASTVKTIKKGNPGDGAQQADRIVITDLKQRAYTTHAGTFTLEGLTLSLNLSGQECFPDSDLP